MYVVFIAEVDGSSPDDARYVQDIRDAFIATCDLAPEIAFTASRFPVGDPGPLLDWIDEILDQYGVDNSES